MSSKTKTTATKEETPPALVPKLRFPAFQEAGGWKDIPIDSILEVRDERRVPTTEAPLYSLTIERGITEKTDRYNREFLVRDAGNKKYKLVEPNDIVYNPSNLRWGAINYSQLSHSVVVSPIYEVLSLGDNSENFLEFIACSVMRDEQIRRFIIKAQGTLVERIAVKIEDFLSTRLPVPPTRAEQQKIAACLSSVDELMAAQARKVDALKTHKKGLMQQLFPREGETQPRLRFPEFQNAAEWEESTVEELIVTVTPPKKLQTADYQPEGEFPIVDQSQDYICGWTNDGEAVIDKGLPVIVFGDHTCALKFIDQPFAQGADGIKILRPKRGIDIRFLYCALEADPVAQESYKRHFSMLKKKKLFYPDPKSGEQQRIASCLSSLDALITAETQKLEALKTHKKGLMQQLFPSPDEVEA
jgi:type I restriction enzyme S subunit